MESEIKPPTGKPASELPVKDLKKQLRRPKLPTSGKKNEVTARHTKDQTEAESTLDDERTLTACKELTQLSEGDLESRINCTSEEKETVPSIFTTRTIKSVRDCTTNISKGKTPTTSSAGASSYTPHRGPLGKFIDTTKLSDRQYEIALFEGLIKTSLRSLPPRMLSCYCYEEEHDIPHIKKKLNID